MKDYTRLVNLLNGVEDFDIDSEFIEAICDEGVQEEIADAAHVRVFESLRDASGALEVVFNTSGSLTPEQFARLQDVSTLIWYAASLVFEDLTLDSAD